MAESSAPDELVGLVEEEAVPEDARPNVLYLLSDQHSPFVSGCYGDRVVSTPNLDALSASGATLTNVYCPSPICVPSRMSMITARHPYHYRVLKNYQILD